MKIIITIIRAAVGWHLFYEGFSKVAAGWSSAAYLSSTYGFLSGFYNWLAASPVRLGIVDFLNMMGLILIGLALFIGLFSKWASLVGAFLLALYFFAYPPFGITLLSTDGTTFIINQLFIEIAILVFLFLYKEKGYGIDNLIQKKSWLWAKLAPSPKQKHAPAPNQELTPAPAEITPAPATSVNTRRDMLKNLASLPVLGLMGWGANRSFKKYEIDTMSGATIQVNQKMLSEKKGNLPKGKIGNQYVTHNLSRLVMGGNLIGGWAHARDLIYAETLFKAYNTEKKIFETLILCEKAGINCINIGFPTISTMVKYKKVTGSKMKIITQVGIRKDTKDIYEDVKVAIDNGMDIIQLQGNWCDWLVRDNDLDTINGMMERIRDNKVVAGMGAHTVDSLIICEENGIIPDYYMQTMHHDNYWSAHPLENREAFEVDGHRNSQHGFFHDNLFCTFPDRTVEFVNRTKIPVMGFKVLAAGSIHPKDGFKWAFDNGADFICVGMFDFQVVEDVNICIETLKNLDRQRGWYS